MYLSRSSPNTIHFSNMWSYKIPVALQCLPLFSEIKEKLLSAWQFCFFFSQREIMLAVMLKNNLPKTEKHISSLDGSVTFDKYNLSLLP